MNGLDITNQIVLFREFLISAWPKLDLLMENHDWENDGKFVGEWLQLNWEFLVERELLGLQGGPLTSFSITPLAKRITPPKTGPLYAVVAGGATFQKEGGDHFYGVPIYKSLRPFSLSSRLLNGYGLYPPFDYANLVVESTGQIFVVPFAELKFRLKLQQK